MTRRKAWLCCGALLLACGAWMAFLEAPRATSLKGETRPPEPGKPAPSVARRSVPLAVTAAAGPAAPSPSAARASRPFAVTEAQRMLADHLEVAKRPGDAHEVEEAFGVSITILRAYAKEVVPLLRDALQTGGTGRELGHGLD